MKRFTRRVHGNAIQAKTVKVYVTHDDIDNAECRKPTKCMIKVALKRALNLSHGYIHVDATGISISRNGSYREKAFMTRPVLDKMLAFDRHETVKPFSFILQFQKTTNITKKSDAHVVQTKKSHRKTGIDKKRYNMRERVIGVAVGGSIAA